MALYTIRRHINGICINPYEYVLVPNGDARCFQSERSALEFVKEHLGLDSTMLEDAGIEIHKVTFEDIVKMFPA